MRLLKLSVLCLVCAAGISSCVKQAFDAPVKAGTVDPNLAVNANIGIFSASCLDLEANTSRLLGDSIVSGIVIGDDRSGNIYKQIVVQDSFGGIAILLDRTNLYGDFPVGRKVYIKLKGLYLVNYRGLPEIAYAIDTNTGGTSGIPSALIGNFIVPASYPHTVTPTVATIADLFSSPSRYLNTLVKLENMEFDGPSANVLYSLSTSSTNRTIKDCPFSGALTMYNSSYSTFQSAITPNGKGSITGIFTTYYTTPQFVLRDTTDVAFTNARVCP